MRLPTRLKLVLVSVLSVLALLLGMLASTGAASAQPLSAQRVNFRISILSAFQFSTQCVALRVRGTNFTPSRPNRPNFVQLSIFGTRRFGVGRAFTFNIGRFVMVNANGQFTRQATACGRFFRIRNVCAQAGDGRTGRLSNVACVRFNNSRPFGFM